jgi:hypothetical protein
MQSLPSQIAHKKSYFNESTLLTGNAIQDAAAHQDPEKV